MTDAKEIIKDFAIGIEDEFVTISTYCKATNSRDTFFMSKEVTDAIRRTAETVDSKRSGRRDEPPFMEPNASAQIALLVSDDAQRVTAPNKLQPGSVTPSACNECLSEECKSENYKYLYCMNIKRA